MHGAWLVSYLVLWALVVVLTLVVVALARQVGARDRSRTTMVSAADEGPRLGDAAPPIELTDLEGTLRTLGGAGPQQLLLFVSPGCGVCEQILPALETVARTTQASTYVVTDAGPAEARREFAAARAPVLSAPELLRDYRVPATPYAVAIDHAGLLRGKGTVGSIEQLEAIGASLR